VPIGGQNMVEDIGHVKPDAALKMRQVTRNILKTPN
jgi:hypothetical protein